MVSTDSPFYLRRCVDQRICFHDQPFCDNTYRSIEKGSVNRAGKNRGTAASRASPQLSDVNPTYRSSEQVSAARCVRTPGVRSAERRESMCDESGRRSRRCMGMQTRLHDAWRLDYSSPAPVSLLHPSR